MVEDGYSYVIDCPAMRLVDSHWHLATGATIIHCLLKGVSHVGEDLPVLALDTKGSCYNVSKAGVECRIMLGYVLELLDLGLWLSTGILEEGLQFPTYPAFKVCPLLLTPSPEFPAINHDPSPSVVSPPSWDGNPTVCHYG